MTTITLYYVDSIDNSQFWARNWFTSRAEADAHRARLINEDEYLDAEDGNTGSGRAVLGTVEQPVEVTPDGVLRALQNLGDPNLF